MPQFFKESDAQEQKFYNSAEPILSDLSLSKDEFFDDAYSCFLLGELLFDTERSPLANAIPRNIFRSSFFSLFDAFTVAGSFESYLEVFTQVFGEEVVVEFTIPGPGRLEIDITAAGFEVFQMVTRYIENNAYVFDHTVDDEGDNIVFVTVKGFESQYELEQMLFEMVPVGVKTDITLTLGA